MTVGLAADYAWEHPAPAHIRAAGYTAVIRYLSGGNSKDITAGEAAALHGAGLGIGFIWETTADRSLAGAAAGASDGEAAARQARGIGAAAGCPLLANLADFAPSGAEIPAIQAYYHAFAAAASGFQAGGYATGYVIDQLVSRGAAGLWWQNAMNDGGQLGSVVSGHASIYQRVRPTKVIAGAPPGSWDEDAFGFGPSRPAWWTAAHTAPPPAPAPVPSPPAPPLSYIVVQLPGGESFRAGSGTVLK